MFCPVKDAECTDCFSGLANQPGLAFAAYPFTKERIDFMERLAEEAQGISLDIYLPHKDFQPTIIFCKLVPHIYESQLALGELTEVSHNVLFELGYALAMGRPAIILRHKQATSSLPAFLGDIERIEYYHRSDILTKLAEFLKHHAVKARDDQVTRRNPLPAWLTRSAPEEPGLLYFIEGGAKLDSVRSVRRLLAQRPFRFESDTALERGHYLANYTRMLRRSQFVVGHLVARGYKGHEEMNAGVSFLLGMAMGFGKNVLVLQQSPRAKPMIDLQGLIRPYDGEAEAKNIVEEWLDQVRPRVQQARSAVRVPPSTEREEDGLRKLDLGDVAAERDPYLLNAFLPTAHYERAKGGQRFLFIGGRGTGKTADFLYLQGELSKNINNLVVVIRPYDSEFFKLRGLLADSFATKNYQYVHGSIWRILLYTEIVNRLVERFGQGGIGSTLDEQTMLSFRSSHLNVFEGSFPERLRSLIEQLDTEDESDRSRPEELIASVVKKADLSQLERLLEGVSSHRHIRVLMDGLDANWDAKDPNSIFLLAGLVDAADSITAKFAGRLQVTVFLRSDIFDVIRRVDPDLDKRSRDILTWSPELLVHLLGLRIKYSMQLDLPPEACWREIFPAEVHGEPIEDYVIRHTQMRPRDVINFASACIVVAQDRFHNTVTEEDVSIAEVKYSETRLADLQQEYMATYPKLELLFDAFLAEKVSVADGGLRSLLKEQLESLRQRDVCPGWLEKAKPEDLVEVLYEVGFLGVKLPGGKVAYAHEKDYKKAVAAATTRRTPTKRPRRKKKVSKPPPLTFFVHPAFHSYLELTA